MLANGSASALATTSWGLAAVALFVLAYVLVVFEERIHLRKSKPVIAAAGLMWVLTALALAAHAPGGADHVHGLVAHHVADFAELFLFLMVAMTYISAIAKHNVFLWLNAWLVTRGFGLRAVFWTTGLLAFVISPVADNLTTALLMGAVVVAVGRGNPMFVGTACTNIVVAANAGGAFSPFGDITTLMVWQEGKVATGEFLKLFLPCVANWLVPAALMSLALPKTRPAPVEERAELQQGWWVVTLLFLATIATAITFHVALHLPPFLGMTTGLCYYFAYGYVRKVTAHRQQTGREIDVFHDVAAVEWDTLLFFFGVIMCVGAFNELGHLALVSHALYDGMGATWANIGIGGLSAVVDNVPVMFAVLKMDPTMGATHQEDVFQWLLVTLTAGVGGSLLSVGSAAGVALMGAARGQYTFAGHLRWLPAILAGYCASIVLHFLLNGVPATPLTAN
ncbi:MAG: sodium:proton antiporter NhaD [Planctomycetota bacterium]